MEGNSMETLLTRGAAVALLAFGLGAPLAAQVVGTVRVRTEPRDSTEIRAVIMTRARLDSISVLMRELQKLQPASADFQAVNARIEALMPALPNKLMFRTNGVGAIALPKGWIGINAVGPSLRDFGPDHFTIQYFDYPSIVAVDPDSPAKRAGIVPGDVLLAYDGVDVRGHAFDLTQMLVPEKKLSVSIRHEGESKDYTLTVAPAPAQMFERQIEIGRGGGAEIRVSRAAGDAKAIVSAGPRGGGFGGTGAGAMLPSRSYFNFISPNGALGAILSTVGPDLAKTLKLEPGVLVNDVTEETPAFSGGLRTGDVIVSAAGQSVTSLRAFQEILKMRGAEHGVILDVVRDRQPRKITVNW
jgi:serine protease Do